MHKFLFHLQPGQEQHEFSILMKDLETCNNDAKMCARKVFTSYVLHSSYRKSVTTLYLILFNFENHITVKLRLN